MKNKLALVTGSFDPITCGHVDVTRRAARLFAHVIVLVAQNEQKQYLFSADERAEIARAALADIPNVTVETWDGYVADFAREHGADAFVRGIRNSVDLPYEQGMAEKNLELCGIDTVLLFAKPEYHAVSSTDVRALLKSGACIGSLMPDAAAALAREILDKKRVEL